MLIKSPIELQNQALMHPARAGAVTAQLVVTAVGGLIAAADLVAAGGLPASTTITKATVLGGGLPAGCTAKIGFLTGQLHVNAEPRTMPAENVIASGLDVAANNEASVALADLVGQPTAGHARSIGIELSANVPAGAATVTLLLEYATV